MGCVETCKGVWYIIGFVGCMILCVECVKTKFIFYVGRVVYIVMFDVG